MRSDPGEVTRLLSAVRAGEQEAEGRLFSVVYQELRGLARSYMRWERSDHSLRATDLVHQAYLRLVGQDSIWQDRAYFGVAARVMRQILVDHSRKHKRRGVKVDLDEALTLSAAESAALVEVDEALTRLSKLHPRPARVVELRFFVGLSNKETAEVLGFTPKTTERDWRLAKAWLARELSGSNDV